LDDDLLKVILENTDCDKVSNELIRFIEERIKNLKIKIEERATYRNDMTGAKWDTAEWGR
jgi:hypothetical protein